jgi:hypothetical protein
MHPSGWWRRAVGAAPPDMLSNRLCPPRPPGSVDRSAQPSVRALGVWIGFRDRHTFNLGARHETAVSDYQR